MFIKSLKLQEGYIVSEDRFSNYNLIFSKKNSKGKSTYLRLLFYALGYQVPSMKGLDYNEISTELILCERDKEFFIERSMNTISVKIVKEDLCQIFSLPHEHNAMLGYIFDSENQKVISNILGIIYVDQDKGWTLLNRGTVIGKIKFNIEELVAGLASVECDDLLNKRDSLKAEISKYSALLDINELSEEVYSNNKDIFVADEEKEILSSISLLELKIKDVKERIKILDQSIKQEESFWNFIDSMCLYIIHDGKRIEVNRKNIDRSSYSIEYIKARKNILSTDMQQLVDDKIKLKNRLENYYKTHTEITRDYVDTQETIINRQLSTFRFDKDTVSKLLAKAQKDLSKVNKELHGLLKKNNQYIQQIFDYVQKYATILKIDDKIDTKKNYIFTTDLKSFSGAHLQKLVFAFKVAFLKIIEQKLGTKFIFVLDSPRGKELDADNLKLMMSIVDGKLKDNQIFIASIYDDFNYTTRIELKQRAIENRIQEM